MAYTFRIADISNPKAKAFLEYVKTLDFIQFDNQEEVLLSDEQIQAINEARSSIKENGGIPHTEAMERMKNKFPKAFRS
jgi:hypothetical protein